MVQFFKKRHAKKLVMINYKKKSEKWLKQKARKN